MSTPTIRAALERLVELDPHAPGSLHRLGWMPWSDTIAAARAALAEPEGEVGELVAWLGVVSEQFRLAELYDEADQTDRAATLLEQLSAAAPAVVLDGPAVQSREPASVTPEATGQPQLLSPAHALPLPAPQGGDVEG